MPLAVCLHNVRVLQTHTPRPAVSIVRQKGCIFCALSSDASQVRSLASASLACSSWRRQAATCPQLYRAAFTERFGSGSECGWWPLHKWKEELSGCRSAEPRAPGGLSS